jgi:deazaflavin-dependent oxidoreductase (nitroreductase family)
MSAKNHPNDAPGVPMVFPPWVERLQIKYFHPRIERIVRRLPGFSVIKHRGRTSGTHYETVVTSYRKGSELAVLLTHGKTNWVKNVLAAGEADIRVSRRDLHLVNPRVLPVGTKDYSLPWLVRVGTRWSGVFVADIA